MRIVVQEWERVLLYRDGRFVEELGAGAHRRRRSRTQRVRTDLRPGLVTVAGQEVLTADGLSVKTSLLARVRTADARTAHEVADDGGGLLYAALQVALRDVVGRRTLDVLLAERGAVGSEVAAAVADEAAALGLALDAVDLRDVVVPAELRRAAADVAVARAQAASSLERARSEVAAVRALANAAKLVAGDPALLHLRTLQAVEAGGATVVLHSGG